MRWASFSIPAYGFYFHFIFPWTELLDNVMQPALTRMTATSPPITAYEYKFGDEGYLLDYHGTKVFYPMYKSLPVVEHFQADPKDVCIVTFPKAGTKFMSAVVWMILHDGDPASLLEGDTLERKVPYLEFCLPGMKMEAMPAYQMNQQVPPRVFFTHLGYDALPESIKTGAKIIYVSRNPKDVMVSTNYFFRSMPFAQCSSTMEETVRSFIDNTCAYAPFFDHVAGYRRRLSDMPNLVFTTYEEMLQDLKNVVKRVARLLEKDLDDVQISNIVRYCSHEQMKDNQLTNQSHLHKMGLRDFKVSPFMRKGIVGDWKNHFTPEVNQQVNEWIEREQRRLQQDLDGFQF
ncbi:sulfotransferase 1B1-like [Paramacrobiotus metropolitanus]|uniref:sulfotransferase 1B1-like n=1 Tax=Paramacrobiotus metropolitanus TaxID=2943436 RepID=UPI002445BF3F|nr:sulfotransferase 1B1-like [Paramacrobiotus metropolitanus]